MTGARGLGLGRPPARRRYDAVAGLARPAGVRPHRGGRLLPGRPAARAAAPAQPGRAARPGRWSTGCSRPARRAAAGPTSSWSAPSTPLAVRARPGRPGGPACRAAAPGRRRPARRGRRGAGLPARRDAGSRRSRRRSRYRLVGDPLARRPAARGTWPRAAGRPAGRGAPVLVVGTDLADHAGRRLDCARSSATGRPRGPASWRGVRRRGGPLPPRVDLAAVAQRWAATASVRDRVRVVLDPARAARGSWVARRTARRCRRTCRRRRRPGPPGRAVPSAIWSRSRSAQRLLADVLRPRLERDAAGPPPPYRRSTASGSPAGRAAPRAAAGRWLRCRR